MKEIEIKYDGHVLSMQGPKNRESLAIRSAYPWNEFSERMFCWLGTMHLVAPYLPSVIRGNFGLLSAERALIREMYKFEGREKPTFKLRIVRPQKTHWQNLSPKKVAIAYSAGKDSMWNLWWASEKYGMDNILVVHVRNLNRSNGPNEARAVLNQQKQFGIKHLEVIELANGSQNTGYQTMRSRDMFLAGLIIPVALQFGATQIITEGFAGAKPTEPFSGLEDNTHLFNFILKHLDVPVRVIWRNRDEMLTIKDLFINRPEWMPHVCNCFTIPPYQPFQRRAWQKRSPSFLLYPSQCGSCVKCRITNVARVLYDSAMANVETNDIQSFLKNTDAWIRSKRTKHNLADMINGSFLETFSVACKRYGVTAQEWIFDEQVCSKDQEVGDGKNKNSF